MAGFSYCQYKGANSLLLARNAQKEGEAAVRLPPLLRLLGGVLFQQAWQGFFEILHPLLDKAG